MKFAGIITFVVCILFAAHLYNAPQSAGMTRTESAAPLPEAHASADLGQVTLSVNGGFYAIDSEGRVWRVIDDTMMRVQGIALDEYVHELIPSANGDIYARGFDRIYRIQNGVATRVETLQEQNARRPREKQITWLEPVPASKAERQAFVIGYYQAQQAATFGNDLPRNFEPDPRDDAR